MHGVRTILVALAIIVASALQVAAQTDPLPSWNDTGTKRAILVFVTEATTSGGAGFVQPEDRIAVFDMDGTLVPEKPMPLALIPVLNDIRQAVARKPLLGERPAIAAILKGDEEALHAAGEAGVLDLVAAATDGRTTEDIVASVLPLLEKGEHPKFKVPYIRAIYQPMKELLAYLEANGFQNWICSGSPLLVSREVSVPMFGIPPARVIGSYARAKLDERDGKTVLVFDGTIGSFNDGSGKPVGINLAIGKRPVFVGGNEGGRGDIAMMRWSKDRNGPSFQLLINHDDGDREYDYAESDGYSLAAAEKYGFQVVSMKSDWNTIIGK